ncbi:MAG: non-heme iron oxygenase ferredoxin subunit [Sphingomonadales bacterium]
MDKCDIILCAEGDLVDGEPLQVPGPEGMLAVFRVNGNVYVTDDACTHRRASLGQEGELEGFTITCAWHGGAFDVRTGKVLAGPCTKALRTYPVTLRGGTVRIPTPPAGTTESAAHDGAE